MKKQQKSCRLSRISRVRHPENRRLGHICVESRNTLHVCSFLPWGSPLWRWEEASACAPPWGNTPGWAGLSPPRSPSWDFRLALERRWTSPAGWQQNVYVFVLKHHCQKENPTEPHDFRFSLKLVPHGPGVNNMKIHRHMWLFCPSMWPVGFQKS